MQQKEKGIKEKHIKISSLQVNTERSRLVHKKGSSKTEETFANQQAYMEIYTCQVQ